MITGDLLQEALKTPVVLLSIKDKDTLHQINNLLPYSTGFEIECNKLSGFNLQAFLSIPYIMAVNCDAGEQRFRIPNGLKGIICLYYICQQLARNSELNMGSGIHYHVDCEGKENWDKIYMYLKDNEEDCHRILKELDAWEYKGTYNGRGIGGTNMPGNWIRFNELKTMEFRIGEMTFDYLLMLNRIVHCNEIVFELKTAIGAEPPIYSEIDIKTITNYELVYYSDRLISLRLKMEALQAELVAAQEPEKTAFEVFREGIKNRVHKINQDGI